MLFPFFSVFNFFLNNGGKRQHQNTELSTFLKIFDILLDTITNTVCQCVVYKSTESRRKTLLVYLTFVSVYLNKSDENDICTKDLTS